MNIVIGLIVTIIVQMVGFGGSLLDHKQVLLTFAIVFAIIVVLSSIGVAAMGFPDVVGGISSRLYWILTAVDIVVICLGVYQALTVDSYSANSVDRR